MYFESGDSRSRINIARVRRGSERIATGEARRTIGKSREMIHQTRYETLDAATVGGAFTCEARESLLNQHQGRT